MTSQIARTEPLAIHPPAAAPNRPPENPLLLAHRYLRGRYPLAAILGVLLSVPCAVIGFLVVPPKYTSTGLVRIAPTMPKTLYKTDENQLMPMFDSFVASQAQLLQNQRVVMDAAHSEALRKAGWPGGVDGQALLAKRLEVKAVKGSEIIQVSVSDSRPQVAKAAVDAVLQSYKKLQEELNGTGIADREQQLQKHARELQASLKSLRDSMLTLAGEYGTDDLDQLSAVKMNQLARLEAGLAEIKQRMARAQNDPAHTDDHGGQEADVVALAERDQVLRALVTEEEQLKIEYERASAKYSPSHRTVIGLKEKLDAVHNREVARAKLDAQQPVPESGMLGKGDLSATDLETAQKRTEDLRASAADELKRIGTVRMNILAVREQAADVKRDLDETNNRLNELAVERTNIEKGRISFPGEAELPLTPSTDRRIPLAVFGGLAGLGLGAGLVWGFGFLRNGYRYADDLETTGLPAPVLGVIPDLAVPEPGLDDQAALSVHHIRNMLQLQADVGRGARGRLFTVTSPMAGEGKTHLALALGLSFAMGGRRTLLIDADLIGRSLSAQLGLGTSKGLGEAIGAGALNGEVHAMQPNLWALPAGLSREFRPEQLSSALLSKLLDQARDAFEVIILDSGPLMGSLEANLASALSDRVVMVVSRGQSPKVVRAALGRLRSVGVACAGLVFNRAFQKDFSRSVSANSLSGRTSRRSSPGSEPTPTALTRALESPRPTAS